MEVSSITGTGAATGSQQSALSSLSSNFDNFLTLLTQQLQNQDPLSPMDTNEFTTQLVQFTGVEQSILTNSQLEKLVAAEQANQTLTALDFIGREISAAGDRAVLANDQAQFAYTLLQDAATASYTIRNEDGDVVFSSDGPTTQGTHQIAWNGIASDGSVAPEGIYSINIDARDSTGNALPAEAGVVGVVTGVESRDGLPVVMIGDLAIFLQDITSVRAVKPEPQEPAA